MLPFVLFVSLALADDHGVLVQDLPAEPWPVGQRLFVAGHEVNLRAAASTDAPVVRELDLGTPVRVAALLAEQAEVGGRAGRWYAVEIEGTGQQGTLFGGVLTPARIDADLDQDGQDEIAVLTWGWEHNSVVRIREPGLEGAAAVVQLDLGAVHDIDGPQERMFLNATTAEATGIPMLVVFFPGREMCGSGTTTKYVSYRATEGAGLGTPRLAVQGHTWSDAPVYSYRELGFEPAQHAVLVTETMGDHDEERETVTTTRLVLRDGVFEEAAPTGTHPN